MKKTLITLAATVALTNIVNAQSANNLDSGYTWQAVNWTILGADSNLINSASGQTFSNIGDSLGIESLNGVFLNVRYNDATTMGTDGVAFNETDTFSPTYPGISTLPIGGTGFFTGFDGGLTFTFSGGKPEALAIFRGGNLSPNEIDIFGPNGNLINPDFIPSGVNLTSTSLTNTNSDSVEGIYTGGAKGIYWQSINGGNSYFTSVNYPSNTTSTIGGGLNAGVLYIGTTVPEPSSALLLGLGSLGLLARRKRS